MGNISDSSSRRKFVWGVGILSILTAVRSALKFPFLLKKKTPEIKGKTVKMLTQDGKLVEIDAALITATRKKATNSELQNWINK